MVPLRNSLSLAIAAFPFDRVVVPRRLRTGRIPHASSSRSGRRANLASDHHGNIRSAARKRYADFLRNEWLHVPGRRFAAGRRVPLHEHQARNQQIEWSSAPVAADFRDLSPLTFDTPGSGQELLGNPPWPSFALIDSATPTHRARL